MQSPLIMTLGRYRPGVVSEEDPDWIEEGGGTPLGDWYPAV